jgi:deoxycytidine triphosphate deaminase
LAEVLQTTDDASPRGPAGGVLGSADLLRRLRQGQIFAHGTWTESNVELSSYDLRIAEDLMVVPDENTGTHRRYPINELRHDPVIIRPGQVARFSSREKFSLSTDLSGLLSVRFSFASRGLLLLTGPVVEPGFGLKGIVGSGSGGQGAEPRVHFFVANVGNRAILLQPGTASVASVQFFQVSGHVDPTAYEKRVAKDRQYVQFVGDQNMEDISEGALGLVSQLAGLSGRFAEMERRLDEVRSGAVPLIQLGWLVLAATFLGVSFTGLLSIAQNSHAVTELDQLRRAAGGAWSLIAVVALVLGLTLVVGRGVATIGRYAAWAVNRMLQRGQKPGAGL